MWQASTVNRPGFLQGMFLFLLVIPSLSQGLSSDLEQPIHIEADYASLNENEGISTYEGMVSLRQGTLNLSGESMILSISGNRIEKAVLTGNPATYVQRPDGKDSDLHAESRRMEYYVDEKRVILMEDARIREPDGSEFRSDRIEYDLKSNTISAGGGTTGSRVHIILQPKPAQGSSPQAAPATQQPAAEGTDPE